MKFLRHNKIIYKYPDKLNITLCGFRYRNLNYGVHYKVQIVHYNLFRKFISPPFSCFVHRQICTQRQARVQSSPNSLQKPNFKSRLRALKKSMGASCYYKIDSNIYVVNLFQIIQKYVHHTKKSVKVPHDFLSHILCIFAIFSTLLGARGFLSLYRSMQMLVVDSQL